MPRYDLVVVTAVAAIMCGVWPVIVERVREPLSRRLGSAESRVAGLSTMLNAGLVLAMLLAGILIDLWSVEWVLIGGSLLGAVAIACLALSRNFPSALSSSLLLAGATAAVFTGSAILMPLAFFKESKAASTNLGSIFFVAGTLLAPLLAGAFFHFFGFRKAVGGLALLGLAPALVAALVSDNAYPVVANAQVWSVLQHPLIGLAGLVCFLYLPVEATVTRWAAVYLGELGHAPGQAGLMIWGFWLTFIAGRIVTVVLMLNGIIFPGWEPWLIMGLTMAAGVTLGNLSGTVRPYAGLFGLMMAGLVLGPILPTLIGMVFDRFPRESGTALGAVMSLGILGNLVLTPLITFYASKTNIRKALLIPTIIAVLAAAISLVLGLVIH